MAIIKRAKNITIKVNNTHTIIQLFAVVNIK